MLGMAAQRKEVYLESVKHMPQQPYQQLSGQPVTRRRVKPKRSLYSFKMLLVLIGIGAFSLAFMNLYMVSQINHIHYEIQLTQQNINNQTLINEQLNVQISELSQQSRITEIATRNGLHFIPENIINISR